MINEVNDNRTFQSRRPSSTVRLTVGVVLEMGILE